MQAGALDRRIRLETQQRGPDSDTGEPTYSWLLVARVWAGKRPIRADEFFASAQVVATADVAWKIRWRDDVFPENSRVLDADGRAYDILGVSEIGRREGLELLTKGRGEAVP